MEKIINCNFDNIEYEIQITGNIDKSTDFTYYTFYFDKNSFIVISKFDGEKWKIANMSSDQIAEKLGNVIDNFK